MWKNLFINIVVLENRRGYKEIAIQINRPMSDEYISIREASKLTGICPQTLRKLSDQNKLKAYKTLSGQRKFEKQYLEEFCTGAAHSDDKRERKNFIYARVVSEDDVDELQRQIQVMKDADEMFETYTVISDIGQGTNLKRKGLSVLLDACLEKQIGEVVITHKDKLSRFAFDLIQQIVIKAGGWITIVKDEKNKTDSELSEDLFIIAKTYCKKG